jgi:Domain of unknown function (DUF5666)
VRMLVALASALVLATAALASAQAPAPAKPTEKKATRNISGTVRSVSGETLVVAGRDKGKEAEWTFAVEPTTNIRKGSKSIVAADLKAGDAVQVRYVERDGKSMAQSIRVNAPRK